MSAPITAILNCYSPATGANRAQVVIRADHTVSLLGDEAIARQALHAVAGAIVSGQLQFTPTAKPVPPPDKP